VSFLAADRLWLLLIPALGFAAYLWSLRRSEQFAVRFSNLELLDAVMPDRPGWRRHLPAIAALIGIVALVMAIARPVMAVTAPREEATVILAVDVSLSMDAMDIPPSRIEAAKEAALRFVDLAPEDLRIGVVAFAGIAVVAHTPSDDTTAVRAAIGRLSLAEGTAVGEGIYAAIDLATTDLTAESATSEDPPVHVVVLSDGETTTGRSEIDAAAEAASRGLPVSTVSFGTPAGAIDYAGEVVPVPVNEGALRDVADITGGTFSEAASAAEFEQILDTVGSQVGYTTEDREVWEYFVAAGLGVLVLAGIGSLVWFSRLP
jgi:Ca-activated chloride channel family protein